MAVRTRKPAAKKKEPAQTQATRHARKQMWAVVLFACGILLGALTWIKGDKLWFVLHEFLFGMFGWSAFFFAPLMIYISVIAALDKPLSTIKNKLWQLLALSLMISGAFQIFGSGLPDEGSFIEDIKSLYSQGIELKGGGMTSLFVAMPLMGLFEKKGASIIIVLCICVFAMLLTGSSLLSLFKMLTRPVKGIENAYAESFEDRQTRKQAKAAQKAAQKAAKKASFAAKSAGVAAANPTRFDYDVDISKDTDAGEDDGIAPWDEEPANPDLPEHPVVSAKPGMPEQPSLSPRERLMGVESPVEYISPGEFAKQAEPEQERQPARRHSLDDDILRAEQETDDEIGNIIDRFISTGLDESYAASDDEAAALINASAGNDTGYPDDYERPVDFASDDQVNQAIPIPPSYISGPDSLQTENPEPEFSSMIQEQNAGAAPVTTIPAFADPPNENKPPYIYKKPSVALLSIPRAPRGEDITGELNATAEKLVETLQSFGVQTRVIDKCRGPAVTRYELQPSAGVKISKITGLADDIALNLASAGIRIEAPIPNKAAVGIEVPNKVISMVSIREILDSREFQDAHSSVSVALGKDIAGNITLADIGKMPHLLIAGSTGSGKSVCINSIIISLLYRSSPDDVKLLMVDPKVVELGVYNGIPHLLVPVVTDPKKAAGALNWAVVEMLRRYKEFADHSVRDLAGYNRLAETSGDIVPMPKIVIIIDELADLMMAAPNEVEDAICRLAQMARAAGMHLVIATQRPSVDVITGVIKANIPSRIAFAVSSMVDSRTILDMGGAEKLLGRGDMLFYPVGASKPQRVQGCFVTDAEVEKVVEFIKSGENTQYDQQIVEEIDRHVVQEKSSSKDSGGGFDDDDDMLPQAIECVVDAGMASTSQLQRRLKLGYARAARIIDQLEERGIVGPFEGSKPRQVLISRERWMEMKLSGAEDTKIKQLQS